jgi:hypothetical protein
MVILDKTVSIKEGACNYRNDCDIWSVSNMGKVKEMYVCTEYDTDRNKEKDFLR